MQSKNNSIKIINVVGARPNFVKIAPIMRELRNNSFFEPILVHTGQHYTKSMNEDFFEDLEIPKPDYSLGVGSGSHAVQTAKIMIEFEKVCLSEKPNLVLVVGDVNSTIACALVAKKLHIKVVHVEAGLRSFDREMPEEINRILTDSISDLLFVTETSGIQNLKNEGVSEDKMFMVGNVMIDSLVHSIEKIKNGKCFEKFGVEPKKYFVLTLHRPSNVDKKENILPLLDAISKIQTNVKIIFPIHPRTLKSLKGKNILESVKKMQNLIICEPLNYISFLSLAYYSTGVLTDSGGIQEETTYFKIPCITIRENTERPSTTKTGSNILVGTNPERIVQEAKKVLENKKSESGIPELWDGKTAKRIVQILSEHLKNDS